MLFPLTFTECVTNNKLSMFYLMEVVSISVMQNVSVHCCVCTTLGTPIKNTYSKNADVLKKKYNWICTKAGSLHISGRHSNL